MTLTARFHDSIHELDPQAWSDLWDCDNPFLRFEFLSALEDSGCVSASSGWQPLHLALYRGATAVAVLPLYLKQHSHGEFVFDWAWAEAYHQLGIAYYPKLLSAVPFTPSPGPRIAFASGLDQELAWREMLGAISDRMETEGISGWHLLFSHQPPPRSDRFPLLKRRDCQFYWRNRGYRQFDDFLAALKSGRRKNVRRERRSMSRQAIEIQRKTGESISDQEWAHFYHCYRHTNLKRSGHDGYLDRAFFELLRRRMPEQLMLVTARLEKAPVASALFLFDRHNLYGRYWGSLEAVSNLHFECCFYQGIEFCIERGLTRFDPGTQGEHKLLRGFEPVQTESWHWIADRRFRQAIASSLQQERVAVARYARQAAGYLPFRQEFTD